MALYLVATPIGNLSDITLRAKEILEKSPILAAEDTRTARRLLQALSIPLEGRDLISYGDHNERGIVQKLGDALKSGTDIAVLSEGGTPLVSDPGYRLVQAAIEMNVPVVPIPGACAAIAALSASGLPIHGFIFRGFLSKKPGARRRVLESLKAREETLIFYESPHRMDILLEDSITIFGPERAACLARELTKLHECFWRGSLKDVLAKWQAELAKGPHGAARGECTLLIAGRQGEDSEREEEK